MHSAGIVHRDLVCLTLCLETSKPVTEQEFRLENL